MPRILRLSVQTDRLPDIASGAFAHLAVRVSAAVAGTDVEPLEPAAVNEVTPWRWLSADAGNWTPHLPASWTIWRIKTSGTPDVVPADALKSVVADPFADFVTAFEKEVDGDVQRMVATSGVERAITLPEDGQAVENRTVFGLVESLTGMPHPSAAAMRVFTVVAIDTAKFAIAETDRFIAAPVFKSPGSGAFKPYGDLSEPKSDRSKTWTVKLDSVTPKAPFLSADVHMRPSWTAKELEPRSGTDRIVNLKTMLIEKPTAGGVVDEDWLSNLASRVAETIDPTARVLTVLDEVIKSADTDTQRLLADDLISPKRGFLQALDLYFWPIVSPRIVSSPARPAPAASILGGFAAHDGALWPQALPLMLAHADREGFLSKSRGRGTFAAVSAKRLAGLVDAPTEKVDDLAKGDAPSIETEAGFTAWLLSHWLMEVPAERGALSHPGNVDHPLLLQTGKPRRLSGRELFLKHEAAEAEPTPVPFIDFLRAQTAHADRRTIEIPFRIHRNVSAKQHLRISLTAKAATFAIDLITDKANGSLTVTGLSSPLPLTNVSEEVFLTVTIVVDKQSAGAQIQIAAKAKVEKDAKPVATPPQPATGLYAAPVDVTVEAVEGPFACAGVDVEQLSTRGFGDALQRLPGEALRKDLALAYVGPFLFGLLAGRTNWKEKWTPPEDDSRPLAQRLSESVAALVDPLYDAGMAAAIKEVNFGTETKLPDLLKAIVAAAKADARKRAAQLVPSGVEQAHGTAHPPLDRLTVNAPPLVFRIDSLQSTIVGEDIWPRLAGVGALIARTQKISDPPTDWRSLNVATFHAALDKGVRQDLSEDTALKVREGDFPDSAVVDPVPYQVSEDSAGIRSVLITYENRSIVGEMPTDARPIDPGTAQVARRIEGYLFPANTKSPANQKWLVPTLSFGYAYHIAPYVVAHGGALPPSLRTKEDAPLEINQVIRKKNGVDHAFIDAKNISDVVRSALYRRTRPVGAPRLWDARKLPGLPTGVAPLAGELTVRPAPCTVLAGGTVRFFLDKEGRRGTVNMPGGVSGDVGIRIDSLLKAADNKKTTDLTIRIGGRKAPGSPIQTLFASKAIAVPDGRLRVELLSTGDGTALTGPEPDICEDEPIFATANIHDTALKDMARWCETWLEFSSATEFEIEPPRLTIVTVDETSRRTFPFARPQLPPEASHQTREVAVIDGITPSSALWPRTFTIEARRPAVEFSTYERWVNPPLFERDVNDRDRKETAAAINAHHARTSASPSNREDRTIDDPAVTRIWVELFEIFPKYKRVDKLLPLGPEHTELKAIINNDTQSGTKRAVEMGVGSVAELKRVGDKVTATCLPGHVYELRLYGGVPETQPICALSRTDRLGGAAHALLRRCPEDKNIFLGTPLTLTVEVTTSVMPELPTGATQEQRFARELIDVELQRPPAAAQDWALMRLGAILLPRKEESYAALRYVDRAALLSQRWSWRGRPQDDRWPSIGGATKKEEQHAEDSAVDRLFESAFVDRSNDDVGDIIERGLTVAHVYAGRTNIAHELKKPAGPHLFQKNLDYRSGANLWRFAWRLSSRYSPMRPNDPNLVIFTHRRKQPDWLNLPVLERPTSRLPKRPGLSIVVPLTEPLMKNGAVPPLLPLFRDQMFSGFNAGDSIEAAIEVARHPFNRKDVEEKIAEYIKNGEPEKAKALEEALTSYPPSGDPRASLRYWQERGFDPVRTGRAADGQPIALRADGPLGYTMDLETEAGRFDHTGIFVSPVGVRLEQIEAWSMVKLRFRRLEAPEGIDPRLGMVPANVHKFLLGAPRALDTGARYRLANDRAATAKAGPSEAELVDAGNGKPPAHLQLSERALRYREILVFPVEHEGLVIDIPNVVVGKPASLEIRFGTEGNADFVKVAVSMLVDSSTQKRTLSVIAKTRLGDAGTWTQPITELSQAAVRIVLSARDKPEQGKEYKPVGDLIVRARLNREDLADALSNPAENRWLSVLTAPLTSSIDVLIADPLVLHVKGTWPDSTVIRPARLSSFTPSVWCQFAESMSVFRAAIKSKGESHVDCDELETVLTGSVLELKLAAGDAGMLESLNPIGDLRLKEGEKPSQFEEVMFLVVTQYVTDVFDLLRERPVAVVPWPEKGTKVDLKTTVWPLAGTAAQLAGKSGRVRFLRMLRSRPMSAGGFEDAQDVNPTNLFDHAMLIAETGAGEVDMNPSDARGLLLGISTPIEWVGPEPKP